MLFAQFSRSVLIHLGETFLITSLFSSNSSLKRPDKSAGFILSKSWYLSKALFSVRLSIKSCKYKTSLGEVKSLAE